MHTKNADLSAFFILSGNVGTAVPNFRFKGLLKKSLKNPQNFRAEYTTLLLRKLLRFQRTFLEKSFVSGFGAEAPTDNAYKKARRRRAFYFSPYQRIMQTRPPAPSFITRCKVSERRARASSGIWESFV